jgi:hypothetical protein
MHELLDDLEVIERFDRECCASQLGEITEKQRDLYKALSFDPPNSSL